MNGNEDADGADFYVGDEELGHLHLNGEMHLATTLELRRHLVAAGLANKFYWSGDWVEASIENEADAERILWLFRLNYYRLSGIPVAVLIEHIAERAAAGRKRPTPKKRPTETTRTRLAG